MSDEYMKVEESIANQSYIGLLLDSPYLKLNTVYRYSNRKLVERNSTAAHTINMQLICLWISDQLRDMGIELDDRDLCFRVLNHDLDECVSCDIPRNIKYHDAEILKKINDISDELLEKSGMPKSRLDDIHNSKHDGTLEGHIVALVDIIEAYVKIEQEYLLQKSIETIKLLYECLGNLNHRIIDLQDHLPPIVEVFFVQMLNDMIDHSNVITGLECPRYEGRDEINQIAIEQLSSGVNNDTVLEN